MTGSRAHSNARKFAGVGSAKNGECFHCRLDGDPKEVLPIRVYSYGAGEYASIGFNSNGAGGGIRTHTPLREADFKSAASAISPPRLSIGYSDIVTNILSQSRCG